MGKVLNFLAENIDLFYDIKDFSDTIKSIKTMLGEPLSKNSIKEFRGTLNPLSFNNRLHVSFYHSYWSTKTTVCKNIITIKAVNISYKCFRMKIQLFEEGLYIKKRLKSYFLPFSSDKLKVSIRQHYNNVYINGIDTAKTLSELIRHDCIYYSYKIDYSYIEAKEDTRHYTKDGKLDKRYTRQNLNKGGFHTHIKSSEEFRVLTNYGTLTISINGVDLYFDSDIESLYGLINRIYTRAGKELPSLSDLIDKGPRMVPLLKDEDRKKIISYLSNEHRDEFEARKLYNTIIETRRHELGY